MSGTQKTKNYAPGGIKDNALEKMPAGATWIENLIGHGTGAIRFRRSSASTAPVAGYRYSHQGKAAFVQIGQYRLTDSTAGMSLQDIRDKAQDLARLRREHPDLRTYLDHLEAERLRQQRAGIEAERQRNARGTFRQLLDSYIADRDKAGINTKEIIRTFTADVMGPFPQLLAMPANEITRADILSILEPIHSRRKLNQADKVRRYLMAAFNIGIKQELQIGAASAGSIYNITTNPVDGIDFNAADKETVNKKGERALSELELQRFYETAGLDGSRIGFPLAQLFRMVIATGGQRIDQLCREPWESFRGDYIRIIDAKGKGSVKRTHLVPHTARTRQILAELEPFTGQHSHPFSSRPDKPYDKASFSEATRRWLQTDFAVIDGERMEHFTPRDLRRSMTQLMQRAGIADADSDRLQSHGIAGIVNEHYRNDPEASLPSKQRTLDAVERVLQRVIDGQESNVIQLHKEA